MGLDTHLSNLRKIIELGGDPNIKTLESNSSSFLLAGAQSPLALLAGGQLDEDTTLKAAMLLVSAGAELDTSDSNGNTPLYDAVRKNAGLVKYLLECGADPNRQCGYFDTPCTSAVRASFSNETVHNYVELIEALLSSGGDPNANFFNGKKEMQASEAIIQRLKNHSLNLKTLKTRVL